MSTLRGSPHAGANTASDHITVLDQALAQIPDTHRHGTDSAGSAKAFLAHVRDVRNRGIRTVFSVGYAITEPVHRAVRAMPDRLWHPALNQDGTLRDGAEFAELTGIVDLYADPAYTSQECSECHHVDRKNRSTQARSPAVPAARSWTRTTMATSLTEAILSGSGAQSVRLLSY
ncbi:zinc ribbon domain-containing protein [Streptomyces sp. NPDC048479]|uniref:zinc ribbon domain-containing protein n=1 Tax=Streptomyces sp. NPDC048479 TaxID=3154725 RepID=UPI0034250354